MTDEVIVRLVNMPPRVRGFVSPSPDGCQNIYLNKNLTQEQLREVYKHEMKHVEENAFEGSRDFAEIEKE